MTTFADASPVDDAIWTRLAADLGIPASITEAVRTPWADRDKPPAVIVAENQERFAAYRAQLRDELTAARHA